MSIYKRLSTVGSSSIIYIILHASSSTSKDTPQNYSAFYTKCTYLATAVTTFTPRLGMFFAGAEHLYVIDQ